MEGKKAHGCAACVCHALLHSGGTHSCAACVFLFVSPFRQQDSKTRAAVLLTCTLDRWLLVTSQLFARMEKMLRPKRAWTLDPQVTVNSPGVLNDSTWHENDNTIECWNHIEWKGNSTGLNKKVCNCVTSPGLRKNWTGGTEARWANTSSKELRGEERWKESWGESRRCAQKWRSLKRVDKRWEIVGRVEKWFHNLRQEVRSPGKSMEVCRSSYKQTFFLDPIALHFLNLELPPPALRGFYL